ncbi:AMP-binding protein [Streptomyces sp. NPDC058052]|uniref:AMP-binding protein n=1 Tax=Streptomyces sp. NPDC058052 TaxID=3346316 RepID=UPI0036E94FBE
MGRSDAGDRRGPAPHRHRGGRHGFATGWTRALCSGGTLVLPARTAPRRAGALGDLPAVVESERVTMLYVGPGAATDLRARAPRPRNGATSRHDPYPALRSLRLLAVTGDRLHLDEQVALQGLLRPGARVLNVYGLAETAGTGAWFEIPHLARPLDAPERLSLLGTPFPGCAVDVIAGEIHLTPPGNGGAIPTGDLGLVREDGLLEFAGRIRDRVTLPDGRALDPYPIESALRGHEGVGAVVVTGVESRPGGPSGTPGPPGVSRASRTSGAARTSGPDGPRLVAYVTPPARETDTQAQRSARPGVGELRAHLAGEVARDAMPRAVVRVRSLPRNRAGQEDRSALPLPARPDPTARRRTAKAGGGAGGSDSGAPASCAVVWGTVAFGFIALLLTDVLWPGSTDLTEVPAPWRHLFRLLYAFEWLAFGAGAVFFLFGRPTMLRRGRGRRFTSLAHLAVSYLLMAWWPQDNLYRLAVKSDWPQQAALVYAFNVPLMLAAGAVALHVLSTPKAPDHAPRSAHDEDRDEGEDVGEGVGEDAYGGDDVTVR